MALSSRIIVSNSPSEMVGASSTWYRQRASFSCSVKEAARSRILGSGSACAAVSSTGNSVSSLTAAQ